MPDTGIAATDRATDANRGAWTGFLVAAFCVVGMIGLVASYAAPLPYQRELSRDAALDRLLLTAPDQRERLRDALGDSADAVLQGTTPLSQRVAAERTAMHARFTVEADELASRLRLMIVVVTLMAATIGAVALGLRRKG